MDMDGLPEGVSPSGRVPKQLLQAAPILKRRRRRNREVLAKKGFILGVSIPRGKYRRRGCRKDPPGSQETSWCGLGWGRARGPPGLWWWPPLPPLVTPEGSLTLIFNIIFLEFFGHFYWPENLKYKNSRKQELATGCTELIG